MENVEKLSRVIKLSFKDVINKVALILSIVLVVAMIYSYYANLPNFERFTYGIGTSFLIWFITRKNGCGSCNQACRN